MNQFSNVVRELRSWLISFSLVNTLIPHALYIMVGSVGILCLYELILFFDYFSFLTLLNTIGNYGFLLSFWLLLISPNIKWTPYGLFARAFLILFPFTGFGIYSIVRAGIYVFFGYWLLKYTATAVAYEE